MRIYLAAAEAAPQQDSDTFPYLDYLRAGNIQHAFISFYAVRKGGSQNVVTARRALVQGGGTLFVDSGAHSFFTENHDLTPSSAGRARVVVAKENPSAYFAKYVAWLKTHWEEFHYFAELDIGELVGQRTVERWRELLKSEGLWSKCVPVYHPAVMTERQYLAMLDDAESRYIALEGDRQDRPRLNYLPLLKPAYDRGVRVHGFAMVKQDAMDAYPFFSVDSSSWKAFAQYGVVTCWRNGKLKMRNTSDPRQALKMGLGLEHASQNRSHFVLMDKLRMSVDAYRKMQDYYTRYWEARGIRWDTRPH